MYYYKLNNTNHGNGIYNLVIAKSLYSPLYRCLVILNNDYKEQQYIIEIANPIILQMIKDDRVKGNKNIFDILVKEDVKNLLTDKNNILTNVARNR